MAEDSDPQPKAKQKSDVKSPCTGEENWKVFGGKPPTKTVSEIEKNQLPSGRARAKDAAGF